MSNEQKLPSAVLAASVIMGAGLPLPHRRRAATTPAAVTSKQRRDYTARQLEEMAKNAAEGIPPAGSVADGQIRQAELSGDFERARALREEVKERAPDLKRMARAQAKAERRAKRSHP